MDECWSCRRRLDRADLLVVVDVPTIADPPADPQTAADELLAEHATQVGALPNPVRLGAHRQILGLLNEGCQPVDVRAGLTRMREKGLGLRLLPDLVAEAQSRRTARKETREPWEIA